MRPKVLNKAKVNNDWVKQHIKSYDLDNIFKTSPASIEEVKSKIKTAASDTLWDFKVQNNDATISLSTEDPYKKIEYPDWQKKCTRDYEHCLLTIEQPKNDK